MYRCTVLAAATASAALALAPLPASAQESDNHAELIERVFAPCKEVAAALDVGDLEQEQRDLSGAAPALLGAVHQGVARMGGVARGHPGPPATRGSVDGGIQAGSRCEGP